jgi:hypothetical protein
MASVEKVGKRWRVPYYESVEGVKRRRYRTFQKKIDAEEFLADQRLEQQGSSLAVSTEERMLIVRLRSVAALAGVSLPEAVQELEQVIKSREKQSPLLKDAVAQYLTSCRERNKSKDTLTQYSGYLTDLITRHHGRRVADVSRADALEYILTRYRNDASRGFVRTSVVSFFRWSQRQGWCTGWDQKLTWDRTRVMEQRVTIMSTEDFTAILRHAPESIRLGLALMGFVGIRPEELTSPHPKTVLRWADIDLPSRCIHIPGAVSKVGQIPMLTRPTAQRVEVDRSHPEKRTPWAHHHLQLSQLSRCAHPCHDRGIHTHRMAQGHSPAQCSLLRIPRSRLRTRDRVARPHQPQNILSTLQIRSISGHRSAVVCDRALRDFNYPNRRAEDPDHSAQVVLARDNILIAIRVIDAPSDQLDHRDLWPKNPIPPARSLPPPHHPVNRRVWAPGGLPGDRVTDLHLFERDGFIAENSISVTDQRAHRFPEQD